MPNKKIHTQYSSDRIKPKIDFYHINAKTKAPTSLLKHNAPLLKLKWTNTSDPHINQIIFTSSVIQNKVVANNQ
jgi:hypothetical protein